MVTAALCPLAETQQKATIWLENYFDVFADKSPDSEEVQLAIVYKKDVYRAYKADMEKSGIKFIQEPLFIDLWNALFPHYLVRPWLDVPGKCEICYEIDTARRKTSDTR